MMCGSAAATDADRHNEDCSWPCHCVTASTLVPGASKVYANYAVGSPQLTYSSEFSISPIIFYVGICYSVFFLLSGSDIASIFTCS